MKDLSDSKMATIYRGYNRPVRQLLQEGPDKSFNTKMVVAKANFKLDISPELPNPNSYQSLDEHSHSIKHLRHMRLQSLSRGIIHFAHDF